MLDSWPVHGTVPQVTCWCGRTPRVASASGYLACECGTLVRAVMPDRDPTRVIDDEHDLYGRRYWFEHQATLSLPDLHERAARDLTGRCLPWLRAVLGFVAPPARVLEIGASHGSFLMLLAAAGFDVTGLELSPSIVDYARRVSGVPMRCGPVEDQPFASGSFDLIAAFDVLEHLPRPQETIAHCAGLLGDEGVLLLQTPKVRTMPDGFADGRFETMLIPEHLYLFTEESARRLLVACGLPHVIALPPVFDTDMLLVASRRPLVPASHVPDTLTPSGRLASALLEIDAERSSARAAYAAADADRRARLEALGAMEALYESADRDRVLRLQRVGELEARLRHVEQRAIDLDRAYQQADRDRVERLAALEALERKYLQADADRTARLAQVIDLEERYRQADRDRAERLAALTALEQQYLDAERDRATRIEALEIELDRVRQDHREALGRTRTLEDEYRDLRARTDALRDLLLDHRNSRVYKAMVSAGRWRAFDMRASAALGEAAPPTIGPPEPVTHTWHHDAVPEADRDGHRTIAVDLTAILPGGENGGAKLVALEVVEAMARLAGDRDFLLITSAASDLEAGGLQSPNIRRIVTDPSSTTLSELALEERLGVLFAPMTAAPFDDPRVPVVSLVHDLQFLAHPEFFDDAELHARRQAWERVSLLADQIITPSAFVRSSVLETGKCRPDAVTAIEHGFAAARLPQPDAQCVDETLDTLGLRRQEYFVYPANAWPHKNHAMLLVAFSMFCRRRPDLRHRLVLTGASRPGWNEVRDAVRRMRLADRVVLAGYVPDDQLAALMAGATALVFPSLYEGYGMPVIEAMSLGCPVACSRATSLPEIAGDAAAYFDARKPEEIADVLERLASNHVERATLATRALARARSRQSRDVVAAAYLSVLEAARTRTRSPRDSVAGTFADGWTGPNLHVGYAAGASRLRIEFENWRPDTVVVRGGGGHQFPLAPGELARLEVTLPSVPGIVQLTVDPTFRPSEDGHSPDTRRLGVRVNACLLERAGSTIDLLAAAHA